MSAGPYSIGSDVWPGLAKLAEESGELVQVIGKMIALGGNDPHDFYRHWDGSNPVDRLIEEMGDVRAAMIFVCEQNGIDKAAVHARADGKLALFNECIQLNSSGPSRLSPRSSSDVESVCRRRPASRWRQNRAR